MEIIVDHYILIQVTTQFFFAKYFCFLPLISLKRVCSEHLHTIIFIHHLRKLCEKLLLKRPFFVAIQNVKYGPKYVIRLETPF